LQCVAVCWSVLQWVAVRCSALQCVAVCCSVLQCVAVCEWEKMMRVWSTATHGSTLYHTATCCNMLQHAATHCNMLQHTATRSTFVPCKISNTYRYRVRYQFYQSYMYSISQELVGSFKLYVSFGRIQSLLQGSFAKKTYDLYRHDIEYISISCQISKSIKVRVHKHSPAV